MLCPFVLWLRRHSAETQMHTAKQYKKSVGRMLENYSSKSKYSKKCFQNKVGGGKQHLIADLLHVDSNKIFSLPQWVYQIGFHADQKYGNQYYSQRCWIEIYDKENVNLISKLSVFHFVNKQATQC